MFLKMMCGAWKEQKALCMARSLLLICDRGRGRWWSGCVQPGLELLRQPWTHRLAWPASSHQSIKPLYKTHPTDSWGKNSADCLFWSMHCKINKLSVPLELIFGSERDPPKALIGLLQRKDNSFIVLGALFHKFREPWVQTAKKKQQQHFFCLGGGNRDFVLCIDCAKLEDILLFLVNVLAAQCTFL